MARSNEILERERIFAEVIPDLVCQCRNGLVVWLNAAGAVMLGFEDPSAAIGLPFSDFVHEDYRPAVTDGLAVLAEEDGAVPLMFIGLDGSDIEAEVRATVMDSPEGDEDVLVHARNLTERVRAVTDVLESEARYRRLVNLALDFMCLAVDGSVSMINAAGLRLLGYDDMEGLVGGPVEAIVHHDYHGILELGLETLAGESGLVPLKFITRDGEPVDVEIRVMRLGEAGGTFMIEARDIRRRLRSAEALREREQRLQGILDTVAEGIVTADERGVIQSFNKAAERIFGYDPGEAVGQNLAILMPAHHARQHDAYMGSYQHTGEQKVLGRGRDLVGCRKDGTTFPIELNISELRLGKARIFTGIIRDITDRKRAEDAERHYKEELEHKVEERTRDLRRLTRETQGILDSAGDGIVGLDMDGIVTFANPAASAMLARQGNSLLGCPAEEVFCYGDGRRRGRGVPVRAALKRGMFHDLTEVNLLRSDQTSFAAEYASSPIEDDGERVGAVVVFRDITERKAAQERLTVAAAVFETTAEGILVCDAAGCISMTNVAFERISGWTASESLHTDITDVLFAKDGKAHAEMMAALRENGHWERELWAHRRDAVEIAVRVVASVVADEDGNIHRIVVVLNDITQRKRDEERIRYQANYDMLTGLPNRALFHDRLDQAVASAHRSREKVGLMFIDLDGFKAINDTLGHEAGDQLLKGAALRLKECVRESDTVARLGGDEFTVIMTHIDGPAGAAEVAARIIKSLTVPFELGEEGGATKMGNVSASIGLSLMPDNGNTPDDLLRQADAAMYHAKEQGKANFQFFRPELLTEAS